MTESMATVLVVEDEFLVRDYVVDQLRDSGFTVVAVGDATKAMEVLTTNPSVGLVFTDVTLPGKLDGFDLVKWIRSQKPSLPVVITSGGHNADKAAEVCKGESFVTKPYDLNRLINCFRRLLGKSKAP